MVILYISIIHVYKAYQLSFLLMYISCDKQFILNEKNARKWFGRGDRNTCAIKSDRIMQNPPNLANPLVPPVVRVTELANNEREAIVIGLLELLENGRLKYGAITEMARRFHVTRKNHIENLECKCHSAMN